MSASTTFIGVDLAWRETNGSGVAALRGDRRGARLIDVALVSSTEIHAYIKRHATEFTVVAIDAPLIIRNKTAQRPCESLISQRYASRHAGCHTSNLSLYPKNAAGRLAKDLAKHLGFRHAPAIAQAQSARVMLEVYPHPAVVELFRLPHIIKYKKGKVVQRRHGQQELQRRIGELSHFSPPLNATPKLCEFLEIKTESLRGANLKRNEDQLDAIVCAYIAYYYWFWRAERTQLFGDVKHGYIIVPFPPSELHDDRMC